MAGKLGAAMAAGNVVFRRIRGRIVPIIASRASSAKNTAKVYAKAANRNPGAVASTSMWSAVGAFYASVVGSVAGAVSANSARKKLQSEMHRGEMVDAHKAGKAVKGVKVITSETEARKAFSKEPRVFRDYAIADKMAVLAREGTKNNAFALRYKGKDYVFTSKKVNKYVIGHELGHIQDYRKNGTPGAFGSGIIGSISGATLRREKRAWDLSPFKPKNGKQAEGESRVKNPALTTYSRSTRGAQGGAAMGVAVGMWTLAKQLSKAL